MEVRTEWRERLRRSSDWSGLIEEFEREAEAVDNASTRAELLFDLAALTEEIVPEQERALGIYQRAWELHPDNVEPLSRARELYRQLGRLEMVAELGELELKGKEGAPGQGELAGLVGEALLDMGDRERALALLEQAVELDPESIRVKDALAALSYESEFWEDDVERLETQAENVDSSTGARMLLRAARIVKLEVGEGERYESLLRASLSRDPQGEATNRLYEALLSRSERWEELEAHHERRAYAAADESERAELYRRFALEWVQRFDDRKRGAGFFARALHESAQNGATQLKSVVAAFVLVKEIYGGRGEWEHVLGLADACLPHLRDEPKLYVATQASRIAGEELGDADRSERYAEIARAIEPDHPALAGIRDGSVKGDGAAEGADGSAEDPDGAAPAEAAAGTPDVNVDEQPAGAEAEEPAKDSSDQAAGAAEGADQGDEQATPPRPEYGAAVEPPEEISDELRSAMDTAREAEAQGTDKAIEAWRQVIADSPEARAPRRELARVLREAERWTALAEALKDEEQKAATSSAQKADVLRELAAVYRDHLRQDMVAVSTLSQVLTHRPDDIEVLDQLAAQYESMKRWPDLVSTLAKKAEVVADEQKKIELHLQIANLYIERFSNQAEAIKAFEKVLEHDPDHEEAIGHLMAVYEKRRDWEKLLRLKEREIDRIEDADERLDKTYEVAKLANSRLKKPDVCTTWWARVLDLDPAHEEALAELEKLYERSKNWEKLAEVCSKKANIAADSRAQVESLQKLGLLYTDKLENPQKAIEAWQRLLEIDESHRRAQDAVKKLYVAERAWDDLETFYRSRGKIDEFVRVLERQVDQGEEQDRVALAMRIAAIYRDEIEKPDRAMRAFEKVLSFDEENLEAAEALIPLYEGGRDPRKLVRVLEIQLAQTEDPKLRQERLRYLAEYSEQKLRDKGAALGWWLRAHEEDHAAEWIRAEVERLAGETGAWQEVVEAYEASYDKFGDRLDALPLMQVVARVQESELGEIDRALETCRGILDLDPQNEAAMGALERLYLGKQEFEELLAISRKKLDLTEEPEARREIQARIGQLYEVELEDQSRAIDTYMQILDEHGEDLEALSALDRLYAQGERWEQLAEVLTRQLAQVLEDETPDRYVQVLFRLGSIREEHLGDTEGAIEAYRDILARQPSHDGAREALERRLGDADHKLAAANILEPIYEAIEEWARLAQVYEIQLETDDDVFRRVELLMRIGAISAQRLGDAEGAFNAYARAIREDPATEGAREQIEELCGLLDDGWGRLVELYESALARDDLDIPLAHELSLKMARAYEERLDNTDKAVEHYRRALQIEPDDVSAIEALERIFTRDESYPDLLDVYRKKVDISSDAEERLSILFRIASIHEEMLQSPEEAISAYNEIIGHDGDNLHALRALDRLYVAGEQWQDLGDNLIRQLTLAEEDSERIGLLLRLAELRETQLSEVSAAIETYRQVLEIQPDNPDAVAALERLLGTEEHELTIAQILEPIYQSTADWQRQVGVYEIMARHAFDPERRIELLHVIAELYEVGGESGEDAFKTFSRAFREDPRNEATQRQLERLARSLDGWRNVVSLYDEVIAEVGEDDLKVHLLWRLAQIYEVELMEDENAVSTYARILEVAPGHVESASAIQAIHERNADYPALVEALRRKSELLFDLPERKELLYRAAQIEEEILDDVEAAIKTYHSVLDLDDVDVPAMDALERLYIRLERWEPLKDVYAKKADLAEDPDEKKRMLYVLGQVFDRELGDVDKAIETYQAILDIEADELPAIQALDRLFGQAERWYDLLQNLERQGELAEYTGEAVGLKYRIGRLWQERLQDLARAIETYREALELDPGHQDTLWALDGLLRSEEGEPVMAARVLEPIYEASAEYGKLIDVLEVMAVHAEDPIGKVELLHRVAELYETRLERAHDAFDAHARALPEESSNELTLGHLERLASWTGQWDALARLYAAEAEKSIDVPQQVDLLTRLARVYEEELGQAEEAIAVYQRILDAEFDNRQAVHALDRLFTAAGRWSELAEILRKEVQLAESDDEILALQFRLAQVLEQSLGDLPAAIDVYREILTTDPGHAPTLSALEMIFLEGQHELEIAAIIEPLYESAGEYEKLHKIYEVQLGKLEGHGERQQMLQRLAELAEEQLADPERAFAWWGQALSEDPRSELAVEQVERLARDVALWPDLVNVYANVLARHAETDVQRDTLMRLARVYEEELVDPTQAVETYLRVLSLDENDADALEALDRLYTASGMYDELVEILRRRIAVTLDGDEIIGMQLRRGHLFAEALGDMDAALGCFEQVLEQDTRNREALEAEERLYFRREAWRELYDTYEKLIDVADDDEELAGVYARMARIASDALADEDGAVDMWTRVLDIRGEEPQSLSALADLHARGERWNDLIDVLERAVTVAPDETAQIALHKQMGQVWSQRLDRERNALDAWLRAYELDPYDLQTLQALAHLYRQTQAWEELSQTLRRILDVALTSDTVAEDNIIELYVQLGQLEGDILGRVDEAVEAWRRVLALAPADHRALSALEQLFSREGRWEECVEVLERRASVTEDLGAQIETLLQVGSIWEEHVLDTERAAATFERVREAEPQNAMASARLEDLYRASYQWEQLNEILLERVEHTDDQQERIRLLQAVAQIYEQEIGDQESAFVVLQAAFREDYSHEDTGHEIERLATAAGKWEDLLQDYTQVVQELEAEDLEAAADLWVKIGRWYGDHLQHVDWAIHSVQQALRLNAQHLGALSALADFQRRRGSWAELIEVLGQHAAIEPDPDKKVSLYLQLGELLEAQIQDPAQAISAYQSALEAEPATMGALMALERLYRGQGMWEPLIDALGRMADLHEDPEESVQLRLQVGHLYDEQLDDPARAIDAYQEVLETEPQNLAALRALEVLYEKTGQSEKYLDNLEAQLDASPTDAERIALYERMASAWEERFGKLDRASECLEKIVALDERNLFAYQELERLYRHEHKWESLVDTFRRHIMATTDASARTDLYCAMGEIYKDHLQDPDRAIEAYTDVLSFDADDARALDALGRLYEQIGEWTRAIDIMSQLAEQTEDPAQKVDLLYRVGRVNSEELHQLEEAEGKFLSALALDETHLPTMHALVSLHSRDGDWLKAAQMMVRAEAYTHNLLDKQRLLYDAARIYLEQLHDKEKAKEYFAAVLSLDPEHVEAGEPLAELYFEVGQWPELSPILDMLVRKTHQHKEPRELNQLYYRTARCADELGDYEKALQYYRAAYDIDSTYLPTLTGRADLLFKMEDWEGAGKIYQTILVQHRDSQNEADVVRTYYRLGMVRQNLGERKKALNMFEKALEIDPHHADTLQAVIDIQSAQGDWEAVIQAKRGLVVAGQPDEQVRLLDEIGDIYHQKLQNPQKAIGTYLEALEVRNDDHQLLQKVLDLYTETEQWRKAVEIIERFVELESDTLRRGSYYQAAGTICRDKIKAIDEAIDYYNRALDSFFEDQDRIPDSMWQRALKAFADIDRILTSKRDWKSQERAYRQMIKRIKPGSRILVELWHALGEIYRSRLLQYQSAAAAFEIAQQLDPENTQRREILAELYVLSGPDHADKAVEQHMELLKQEPFRYESYKALRQIYMDTHQYDKTWCVCNALAFLKKADAEEMQFYEQYKPRGFVKARQRMTEDIWRRVYHPDENLYVGAVFGAIWQGAAMLRAQSHKELLGLKRKERRQVENDQLQFSKIFYYTSQVLGVALPDVFLQPEHQGEIAVANTHEKGQLIPSFVIRANLLQGRPEKEIAFTSARWLTLMRPEHYLKIALPTNTELKTAFLSAIALVRRDFPLPGDMQERVAQYLPEMQRRIPESWLEQLGIVVNRFLQTTSEINLAKWSSAVDLTSHRTGFIVSGDLDVAARMVSQEPAVVGGPNAKEKIKELVLYSISEDYFTVRHHLGLTIG